MKILLLEDDFRLASEIKLFLSKHDYSCEVVQDGSLFFKQLLHTTYDLYILDINVPRVNGLEVCKKLRKSDPLTPAMMLTAYSTVEDKVHAFNYGADDYFVKPFLLDELSVRIKALLRRQSNP